MKLKNKETGEIVDVRMSYREDTAPIVVSETTCDENGQSQGWPYNSLAELNAEWEDMPEEPKKFWWISDRLTIYESEMREDTRWFRDICKRIGNYFETKEEAEKTVEKLKAWKRLKDSGFRFNDWRYTLEGNRENNSIPIEIKAECKIKTRYEDLVLLFGGEE